MQPVEPLRAWPSEAPQPALVMVHVPYGTVHRVRQWPPSQRGRVPLALGSANPHPRVGVPRPLRPYGRPRGPHSILYAVYSGLYAVYSILYAVYNGL
ncbi:hypothetical protein BKA93DRAFT_806276 [Sparassis latifolia]